MATEPGRDLAAVLDGLGGAPARPGVVHVVGAGTRDVGQGPADPGHLTLRAAVLVASADHVVVEPYAATDVLRLARADAGVDERHLSGVTGTLPTGSVVVVVAGDPTERADVAMTVADLRDAGRTVEVLPGVGRARAALAAAGASVPPADPRRDDRVAVLVDDAATLADTGRELLAAGWADDDRALVLTDPATPRQAAVTTTVAGLADTAAVGTVVVVVGSDHHVPWRADLPLAGVSVLVPRANAQASALSMRIRSLGGEPVESPAITIEPGDDDALRAAVRDLADGAFVAVCLTSPNGVDALADAIDAANLDARAFAQVGTVACVGPGTAARLWDRLHLRADLVPDVSTSAALGAAFAAGTGRVLLPRADIATPMLSDALAARGYEPVEVAAYVTGAPAALPTAVLRRLETGGIDLIAFASSSTARNFAALVGDRAWRGDVVSIGPVTSATCAELGIRVAREADPHDLDGLVAALCEVARGR